MMYGNMRTCFLLVLAGFLMVSGCGNDRAEKIAVDEHDGAELSMLMENAHKAIKKSDENKFQTLFSESDVPQIKTIWRNLEQQKKSRGLNRIEELTNYPELERAVANVHVKNLTVELWFHFINMDNSGSKIASATWKFKRSSDNKWLLDNLRIGNANTTYGDLMKDLSKMSQLQFQALSMDWEEAIDPSPLLAKTLQALAREDMETLKGCTVDGTLFYAQNLKVEMPTIGNDADVTGKYNRELSVKFLKDQCRNIKEFSSDMKMEPTELLPYFSTYRVSSIPPMCTKLRLMMKYEGGNLAENVKHFSISWTSARIQRKWLVESMYIDSIEFRQ